MSKGSTSSGISVVNEIRRARERERHELELQLQREIEEAQERRRISAEQAQRVAERQIQAEANWRMSERAIQEERLRRNVRSEYERHRAELERRQLDARRAWEGERWWEDAGLDSAIIRGSNEAMRRRGFGGYDRYRNPFISNVDTSSSQYISAANDNPWNLAWSTNAIGRNAHLVVPIVEALPEKANINDMVMLNKKVYVYDGVAWNCVTKSEAEAAKGRKIVVGE